MHKKLIYILLLILIVPFAAKGQLVNIKDGATFKVSTDCNMYMDGSLKVDAGGTYLQGTAIADSGIVRMNGDLLVDGTFNQSGGFLWFYGNTLQNISGSGAVTLNQFIVGKDGSYVLLGMNTRINRSLRLVGTYLNVDNYNLTLGPSATVSKYMADTSTIEDFTADHTIYLPRGQNGGEVFKELATTTTTLLITLPLSTTDTTRSTSTRVYSPISIDFWITGSATYGANAWVGVKVEPKEHPDVETKHVSLMKYWTVRTNDLVLDQNNGVKVVCKYDQNDVATGSNEGSYKVMLYTPPYNDPNSFWKINPGKTNDVVDFNVNAFYSNRTIILSGNWTAGDESAAQKSYYSRKTGDYNVVSTWSNQGFGGVTADKIPNKRSDRVFIGDGDTVNLTANPAQANLIEVQSAGTLKVTGDYRVTGDTTRILDGGRLLCAHSKGFTNESGALASQGCFGTDKRILATNVCYEFIGNQKQTTGDGMPDLVSSLKVNKPAADTVYLGKNVSIKDSLVIQDGILNLSNNTINGQTANRAFIMRAGELITNSLYPQNYSAGNFAVGTIHFAGTGNITIPSSTSNPAVNQYFNLKLSGTHNGVVTFRNSGEIKISNIFNIDNLEFNPILPQRFVTDGSTVVFNKNTAASVQIVPNNPGASGNTDVDISYYNITFDGLGEKRLRTYSTSPFTIGKDLEIKNSSNLNSNAANLYVSGNWLNSGGTFTPTTGTVKMISPTATFTTNITTNNNSNDFYNLIINGDGSVKTNNNLNITKNLTIDHGNFNADTRTINLSGDWINDNGQFLSNTSTVVFNGTTVQKLQKNNNSEIFWNLTVNCDSIYASNITGNPDVGVQVNNDLTLTKGILHTRGKFVKINNAVIRTGALNSHVDGSMRKSIALNNQTVEFELGYGRQYTPLTLNFHGTAGRVGFIQVTSDTLNSATSPISFNGTLISPANSAISNTDKISRQWTISLPTGSTFELGVNRKFDATMNFRNPQDLTGGCVATSFEPRILVSGVWVEPSRFGDPFIGTRTNTSTQFSNLTQLGTLFTGMPYPPSYYSIDNGDWNTPASWSTQGYGGIASTIIPTLDSRVYIGDSKKITVTTNLTANGRITIDSSGTLSIYNENVISGSGEFRLTNRATLEIGHSGGISTSGATGNIQMTTRNYNYLNHNRGNFVYTRNVAAVNQLSGNGLPDTLAYFALNHGATTPPLLVLGKAFTAIDSINLIRGTLRADNNITLWGNLNVSASSGFTPQTSLFTFAGLGQDTITSITPDLLVFYNLEINKKNLTGDVVLNKNTSINISHQLSFNSANESQLVARLDSSYVQIVNGGSVVGYGSGNGYPSKGWVDGELRKWITADISADTVFFEIGNQTYFTPFGLMFTDVGDASDQAGYVGAYIMDGYHPDMNPAYADLIGDSKTTERYWRVVLPKNSTFRKGARQCLVRIDMANPLDFQNVDSYDCMDIVHWNGISGRNGWTHLDPDGTGRNSMNLGGGNCSDTRNNTGQYNYFGGEAFSANTGFAEAWPTVGNNFNFGSTLEFTDGSFLLGDFLAGQSNEVQDFTRYYSCKSGYWDDPATWSTVGYGSTTNTGGTTYSNQYPIRQYDQAFIGGGYTVTMRSTIGSGDFNNGRHIGKIGPNTIVQADGTLEFGTNILNGNSFKVEKGGTLIIGSTDGIDIKYFTDWNTRGWGCVQTVSKIYEDSINVIYKPQGLTTHAQGTGLLTWARYNPYCSASMDGGQSNYITNVRVLSGATQLMRNNTGANLINHLGFQDFSALVTAGSTYTLEVNVAETGDNHRARLWMDLNYDGDFNDANESINSNSFNGNQTTISFTIPAGTQPGGTGMRVKYNYNKDQGADPCSENGDYGETEDYWLNIQNTTVNLTQITGEALPNNLRKFVLHKTRNNKDDKLVLGKPITVRDSLWVKAGQLDMNGKKVEIKGNLICDTLNGLLPNSNEVSFYGNTLSKLRGTSNIDLYTMSVNKTNLTGGFSNLLRVQTAVNISNSLAWNSITNILVDDSKLITFGQNATITAATFNNKRLFKVSGDKNSGKIKKVFTTTTGVNKQFLFPVGVDTTYNPADLTFRQNGAFSGNPSLSVQLVDSVHEKTLFKKTLKKFWKVESENIGTIASSLFKFNYTIYDTLGNGDNYIPGLYSNPFNKWEINLGDVVSANNGLISCNNTSGNFNTINGDWTAGEPTAFFASRRYYSIADGNWSNPNKWSNTPGGPPASYFPGQVFNQDSVFVLCNKIIFDVANYVVHIDTLQVGDCSTACYADLTYADNLGNYPLLHKSLYVNYSLRVCQGGSINRVDSTLSSNQNKDSLTVNKELYNNSARLRGIRMISTSNDYTLLRFAGNINTTVSGTGVWSPLSEIILDKVDKLADTLIINSTSFANESAVSPDMVFIPIGGVLKQSNPSTLYLSGADNKIIDMGVGSAFHITNGVLASKGSVIMNSNTNITLTGGRFDIGNSANDDLLYRSGSSVVVDGGNLIIAGVYGRENATATTSFSLSGNSTVKVMDYGQTNTNKIPFDISSSGSSFEMDNGRIVIANPLLDGQSDFRVNATSGLGMTAGTIQFGDTAKTYTNDIFKTDGTLHLYNVHTVGANSTTNILSDEYYINNTLTIDNNTKFDINGNILHIKGNLTNYGIFNAKPSGITTDNWKLVLDGTLNQYLYNDDAGTNLKNKGFEIYQLKVDKLTGNVILGNSSGVAGNSEVTVYSNLEFALNNNAYINSRINNLYFLLATNGFGSNPTFTRSGLGHVDGYYYQEILANDVKYSIPVGSNNITDYYPVDFQTKNGLNTVGIISTIYNKTDHPQIDPALIDMNKNIKMYWDLGIPAGSSFVLGTNNTFNLTTHFKNPQDVPPSANLAGADHFVYYPGCPDPTNCLGGGTWTKFSQLSFSLTSLTSKENTIFGDFVIGEPVGVHFYSIAPNGDKNTVRNWDDINTWSRVGYGSNIPADRIPNQNDDIVHIGDGCKVFLATLKQIHTVSVEDFPNLEAGSLYVRGYNTDVSGQFFSVSDSCLLAMQHFDGLDGVIKTNIHNLGIARYMYYLDVGGQNSGRMLPDSVSAIIQDNRSIDTTNNSLMINNVVGAGFLKIRDSLSIINGKFEPYSRKIKMSGLLSIYNDAKIYHAQGEFKFANAPGNQIHVYNKDGVAFGFANIAGGDVNFTVGASPPHDVFRVIDSLQFSSAAKINVRNVNLAVKIFSRKQVNRLTPTSGFVNGLFSRPITALKDTVLYAIGTDTKYLPMTLQFDNGVGGIAGYVESIVSNWPPIAPDYGHRLDPAKSVLQYWRIVPVAPFVLGARKINPLFDVPLADISTIDLAKAKIRRKSLDPTPIWTQRIFNQILWQNTATRSRISVIDAPANLWDGFGEFFIGDDWYRIFYSLASGFWDNPSVWTFSPTHNGAPLTEFPTLATDSVVIGTGLSGEHTIAMTQDVSIHGMALGSSPTDPGTLNTNGYALSGLFFNMAAGSTLMVTSPDGISAVGQPDESLGNIRTTVRNYGGLGELTNFVYSGNLSQVLGSGLPIAISNLTIDNTGPAGNLGAGVGGNNNISVNRNLNIYGNLAVDRGVLMLQNFTANSGNGAGTLIIMDNASINIGGTNNLLTALNNYAVYSLTDLSYVEFSGAPQFISQYPANFNTILGFGNVNILNPGIKTVNSPMTVRTNLFNSSTSTLINNVGVNQLFVKKSLINRGNITNEGNIQTCQ